MKFKQPAYSYLSEGDYSLQFLYGHDKQRRLTTFYNESGLAMEKYFVGLYEKEVAHTEEGVITRHINYITAGDGMTAIVIQEEQDEEIEVNTYFTYKDHLGSIVTLTDESGNVAYEQSFDAWGRYRNPYDWTFNDIPESPTWLRGYTGHCLSRSIFSMFSYEIENSSKITIGEHLPHFDLVNMNGRIYDPILGRMLSPDRFVPDPLSTQGYNRYAYVLNNPLRYSDPSGDLPVIVGVAIGAVVGGYIGGAVANNTINIAEWEWDKNTAIGITIGALTGAGIGAGIGAAFAGKLGVKAMAVAHFNAPVLKSGLVSGGLNMMYNYESGQTLGTSLGYFGAGFAGGVVGFEVGTLIGMMVGGTGNVGVLGADKGSDATFREYAQKFVSGAINSYVGPSIFANDMFGHKVNYMKMADGSYFGGSKASAKAWRAGWLNQASDFAHSSQETFNNRSLGERMMMFGAAGGSSIIGGAFDESIDNMRRGIGKSSAKFGMALAGGSSDYLLQQTIHGSINHNSNYYPFNYQYGWKKTSIFSYKSLFYSLAL